MYRLRAAVAPPVPSSSALGPGHPDLGGEAANEDLVSFRPPEGALATRQIFMYLFTAFIDA